MEFKWRVILEKLHAFLLKKVGLKWIAVTTGVGVAVAIIRKLRGANRTKSRKRFSFSRRGIERLAFGIAVSQTLLGFYRFRKRWIWFSQPSR